MSYCRFDDGDVYAYETYGGVQFWVSGSDLDRLCTTFNEAYQYAKALRDEHGIEVPSYAIEALKADAIEEAKGINGPVGAIADLCDENAVLRGKLASLREVARLRCWWCRQLARLECATG